MQMDTDYILHRIIRRIASWAVYSFFTEVRVIGGEKVPAHGPIIVYVMFLLLTASELVWECQRRGGCWPRVLWQVLMGCLGLQLITT